MRSNLSYDGFTVITLPPELVARLLETLSYIVQLVNSFHKTQTGERNVSDLTVLREDLATGLSQNDAVSRAVVEHVLQTAHESIWQIREDIIPALAQLAQNYGIDAEPHRAIARFRIASNFQSDYDHLWHQDSIDLPSVSKGQRTSNLGFWIPLHDVGIEEGTIEFSLGSHFQPISHTETDECGRFNFPAERVKAYKKCVVPVSFGSMLALDSWVAHRAVPNTSRKIRIALLVWF